MVAWWQDDIDGYIWMRRFINGAWDVSSFRVKGATKTTSFHWNLHTGIDRLGAGQLMFLASTSAGMGEPNRVYWVRWAGEDSIPLETPPLVLGDQGIGFPLSLAVTEQGLGTAQWLTPPETDMATNTSTQSMYTNTLSHSGWNTPVKVQDIRTQGNARNFAHATNGNGDFVTAIRYAGQDPETSYRTIETYIYHDASVTVPAPIEVPERAFGVDMEIDTAGNVTALIQTSIDAQNFHVYWSRFSQASKAWRAPELLGKQLVRVEDLTLLPGAVPFAVWLDTKSITESVSIGRVVASSYDVASQTWAEPLAISEEIQLVNGGMWASANSAGSIVVVWAARGDADATAMYFVQYTKLAGWGKPAVITPFTGEISMFGLTLAEDGRALLVWQEMPPGSRLHDIKWSRSR